MGERLFFLGVDGGGTHCRARLVDAAGTPLGAGAASLTVALAEGRTEIALGRFGSPYRMLAEVTVG